MKSLDIRFIFIVLNLIAMTSVFTLWMYAYQLNQMNIEHEKDFYTQHTAKDFQQDFQSVGDEMQSFVYSAVYDDIERPLIRVIALVLDLHLLDSIHTFICTYSNIPGNSSHGFIGTVQYVPEPDWGYSYRSAFIRCEVPKGQKPDVVTISLKGKPNRKINIKVIYPLEKKWRLTRCYSVLHSNFSNIMQFIQTMEISLMFGVEHFVVYNYEIHDSVLKTMQKYQNLGILEILPWNLPINNSQIHYFGQLASIQDCVYRNLHVSEYLLTGDTDEILVPKIYNSTLKMIQDNLQGKSYCSGLVIRSSFFPLNLPQHPANFPYRSEARRLNITYLLYTSRLKVDNPYKRSKFVLIPTGVEIVGVHDVGLYRRGKGGCVCQYNHCLLHHYRHLSKEELTLVKATDVSLHKYSETIVKHIRDRLTEFGITQNYQ